MAKRFEVFRKGSDGDARDIRQYSNAVDQFVDKIPAGEGYEYKRRGDDVWKFVTTKPRLKKILLDKRLAVGEAFLGRRDGGRIQFVFRAIEIVTVPDYPDKAGLPGIKDCWNRAWVAFKALGDEYEFVFMGAFVCRKIDGSSSWSQHAFHQAFDFRIRRKSQPDNSIDTTATTKVVNAVKFIAAETLWLVASHYFHAHITGPPKQTGIPACA